MAFKKKLWKIKYIFFKINVLFHDILKVQIYNDGLGI